MPLHGLTLGLKRTKAFLFKWGVIMQEVVSKTSDGDVNHLQRVMDIIGKKEKNANAGFNFTLVKGISKNLLLI